MRHGLLICCVLFTVACKNNDAKQEPAPPPPAKPTEAAPPAPSVPPAAAPLAPPAPPAAVVGTPTVIKDIAGENVVITLPPGIKIKNVPLANEVLPSAWLRGNGLSFTIEMPEAGYFGLDAEKRSATKANPGVTFDHAEANANGFTLMYKLTAGEDAGAYHAVVALETPPINCGAYGVDTKKHAEQIVALCQTMAVVK